MAKPFSFVIQILGPGFRAYVDDGEGVYHLQSGKTDEDFLELFGHILKAAKSDMQVTLAVTEKANGKAAV